MHKSGLVLFNGAVGVALDMEDPFALFLVICDCLEEFPLQVVA